MKVINLINRIIRKIKLRSLNFLTRGTNLSIIDFPIYLLNNNVSLGDNVVLYPNITFFGQGNIYLGNNIKIGNNVIINATKGSFVKIGDNVSIAANTYIIDCNDNTRGD